MKTIYIYSLKDPVTNKIRYIGKSTNPERRLKAHLTRSNDNKYHSARWIASLKKKGLKPILDIVEPTNENEWEEREKYWISYFRKDNDLTNFLDGGEGGATYGRLGKPWSNEQRINNKIARTGLSVNHTKEGNENRQKGIRRYCDKNKKPVLQYNLNGNFKKEWESAVDAGKGLNISHSDITKVCKKNGLTAKKYMWLYKNGEIKLKIDKYVKPDSGSNVIIKQLTKEGKLITKFPSLTKASEVTKISISNISNCLTNRSKSAGGYKWEYK